MTKKTDPWPQRLRFRNLVDHWIETNCKGMKKEEARQRLASSLDLTAGTLKQYYLGSQKGPSRELIERMSFVFGCSTSDFMDEQAQPPPGIDHNQWAGASPRTRVLIGAIFSDLVRMPEDLQQIQYELWQKGIQIHTASLDINKTLVRGVK